MQLGGSNSTAAFEFTTNQVTYPLMAYILLNPVWYKNLYYFVKDESPELLEGSAKQEETVNNEKIDEESMEATMTKTSVDKIAILFKSLKTSGNEIFSTNEADAKVSDEAQSITVPFFNNTICFHPLLPIYMITQAYYDTISNEYIHESNDFELFINYYKYLQVLSSNVIKIYEKQDDATVSQSQINNKITAYAIGLGLKEFLFTSNNSQQGYKTCLETLGLRDEDFSEISSLTHLLSSSMIGRPELNVSDEIIGKMFLESSIFEEFIRSVDITRIFNETLGPNFVYEYNSFKNNVFGFLDKLSRKIIEDRGYSIEHDSAYLPSSTSTETPSYMLSDSQIQTSIWATPTPTPTPTISNTFVPINSHRKRTIQDNNTNIYADKKRLTGFDVPTHIFDKPNMTAISVRGGLSKKNKIKRRTNRKKTSITNKIKSRKQKKHTNIKGTIKKPKKKSLDKYVEKNKTRKS